MKTTITLVLLACSSSLLFSQSISEDRFANKWTLEAGLAQPVLMKGVNIAGTYFTKKFTFEYSHGMFLNIDGTLLKDKNIKSVYVPYTTGLGVGYRLTRYLDIRAEAKAHKFEAQVNEHQKISYHNFDLGAGAYYRIYPFGKSTTWAKGILIEPSVRYWQHVRSTLKDNQTYVSDDGQQHTLKPYNFGFFGNVSVGYTF